MLFLVLVLFPSSLYLNILCSFNFISVVFYWSKLACFKWIGGVDWSGGAGVPMSDVHPLGYFSRTDTMTIIIAVVVVVVGVVILFLLGRWCYGKCSGSSSSTKEPPKHVEVVYLA